MLERCTELDEPWVRPSPPLNLDVLIEQIAALPYPSDAIEALWDGDTNGWLVCLAAVTLRPKLEHKLARIRHCTDIRIPSGQVPPWPEAHEAASIGCALAERLGVPFHFASPYTPNLDLPRWWDDKAQVPAVEPYRASGLVLWPFSDLSGDVRSSAAIGC